MRSVTWLVAEEETSVMDLSPVAAKAHRLRIQKAAFGGFQFPKIDTEAAQLHGRVKPGRVNPFQTEMESSTS